MNQRIRANIWWLLPLFILLAFVLQDVFQALVVTPLAYAWFRLGLYYRLVPQPIYWLIITVIVGMIALGSLAGGISFRRARARRTPPPKGQVETLTLWLKRTRKGTYFKWLVANRLGKLALSIVGQNQLPGPRRNGLNGQMTDAPDRIREYLRAALERTSTDYHQPNRFARPRRTPFDIPVSDVVTYLESILE